MRHHTQSTDSVRSEDEQEGGLRGGHKGGGEEGKRERHIIFWLKRSTIKALSLFL